MTVEIHIEELVLRGVAAADADAVTAALRTRLDELARGGVAPTAPVDDGAAVHRTRPVPARDAVELGSQAAAAVWTAAGGRAL